jgi:hypothetical protein
MYVKSIELSAAPRRFTKISIDNTEFRRNRALGEMALCSSDPINVL